MSGGSLGIRSGSYGSLDKQLQNGLLPIQTARKPSKMFKEKETLFHWICKFAGRKKVGMLLLCVISAAVFAWVLYVGKGEDTSESAQVQNISVNGTVPISDTQSSVISLEQNNTTISPHSVLPPPPPNNFLGYTLPTGHPCNSFTLPPPPADKKRIGPRPCPVCYLPVEEAIALMPREMMLLIYAKSMCVHCGFVRGSKPGRKTGYDMDEADLLEMEQCDGVVVASAIFGNFDEINQPRNISDYAKETVCFYMFIDEETESYMKTSGTLGSGKKIGMWRIVVVHNLPYPDARRTGKIPKLLLHRMFPNARYSLWIDGKLELVVDPYQVLERFLWRKNATFAISKHYRRFDVFMEAEANKAAGKYDNASIDLQVEFYKNEGLTPYSEAKLPILSDVPEGCVVIKEHVPLSNLFTCLWFNEVDRFTSRDQISFSTVRDKIRSKVDWKINMFLDCERRNFVVQKYHRDVLEHLAPPMIAIYPPPPPPPPPVVETSPERFVSAPVRKVPARRGRDRKSRHHRKVVPGSRDIDSS
ncbi:Inner membrane protein oxaA [Quillaja saponaria]|uniref:Inner membrane protein oxaA n=1 Tax=Quillaja saponaria TaxID=32244 RepID=A0AAD7KWB4_QUISA|nr:Inner membrane protein oxaA [Quillaja saponaria]